MKEKSLFFGGWADILNQKRFYQRRRTAEAPAFLREFPSFASGGGRGDGRGKRGGRSNLQKNLLNKKDEING